ncbi:MAG: DnaJ domain-containing protein, partial [Deltaproteobacteria bacterium]|nr:DnaJ domain-containing protein [Deltaproteobacteria bacterium]
MIYPLVCLGCGLVLAPRPLPDYFALFGLPVSHRLDTPRLETAYKKLSMALHPDFHSGSEAFLRQKVLQYSSLVNTAYGVLKDEFRRAGYLLGLLAGQTALDAARLPPDFLEEMFLLQETLEAAGETEPISSSGGPRPALDAIQLSARTRLDALKTQREDLFALAEAAMQQT